jgi:hypothetical protein
MHGFGRVSRSRGASSFDLGDCFSKENHIEDIMGTGNSAKHAMMISHNPSLFKK